MVSVDDFTAFCQVGDAMGPIGAAGSGGVTLC